MIRELLVVGYLLCGEVFCTEPACINYTPNRFEYENSVIGKLIYLEMFKTDATARIVALERQSQGASTPSPLAQRSSLTYIHWGMKSCPNGTTTTMV
ncbi:hypothetical protein DPMN_127699 [Dreissena polymorpha]|uniref:Secreted protein n=1 Tax=Dreissena polymorpha TaxID=45954 RepID=A0A9D4JVP6_DREPO|nr:hypothetical protein DPMN_127699 [Dreissena polymorpha]